MDPRLRGDDKLLLTFLSFCLILVFSLPVFAAPQVQDVAFDNVNYVMGMEVGVTPTITFLVSDSPDTVSEAYNFQLVIDEGIVENIPSESVSIGDYGANVDYTLQRALSVGWHDLAISFDSDKGSGSANWRVKVGAPEAMLIYPNPVKAGNSILVQIDSEENVSGHLQLIGPHIFPYKSDLKNLTAGTTAKFTIDTTELPNAMYYAVFSDLNGRIIYKTKLVVAN